MNRIIAFTKDWNDVPTCTTHILREMGKTMPVLWVNSIGMRRPQLRAGRDIRRIVQRIKRAFRGPSWIENQLSVLSPLVLPKANSQFIRSVNRQLLAGAVNRHLSTDKSSSRELWAFVPNAVDYLGCFNETKVVYYCVDDWTLFSNIDAKWITDCEHELLRRADVVFATSRFLEAKCRAVAGDRVHYMPHGVQYNHFATAVQPSTQIPSDLAAFRQPRIGYYGNIRDWIDFELLKQLATLRPSWSFIMIGPVSCDISTVATLPNVHFFSRREPAELPAYCKGFDVAIIPYRTNDVRMDAVNPIKLRELLAAGVPVVAADIPEVRGISQYVRTARSTEDYLTGLETFLAGNFNRAAISEERRTDDWPERVREIRRIVETAQ